jgi:hypothetical protein
MMAVGCEDKTQPREGKQDEHYHRSDLRGWRAQADPDYVARLERHYRQVKEAMANPSPDVQRILAEYGAGETPKLWRRKNRRSKPKRRKK